jgi:hypothetical protein
VERSETLWTWAQILRQLECRSRTRFRLRLVSIRVSPLSILSARPSSVLVSSEYLSSFVVRLQILSFVRRACPPALSVFVAPSLTYASSRLVNGLSLSSCFQTSSTRPYIKERQRLPIATMSAPESIHPTTETMPLSSLHKLPAELRFQIYTHMASVTEAPFWSYCGLYLSCKAIHSELEEEGAKVLRRSLEDISSQWDTMSGLRLELRSRFSEMRRVTLHLY